MIELYHGDCLEVMAGLPAGSINTCVTSPPYFGLRDYEVDGQIGLEDTPEAFVGRLVEVFREVRRVLRDDGTLWLNLGDSYARNPAKGTTGTPNGRNVAVMGYSGGAGIPNGLKEKDLIGIPWRVAFALQADGWYLRQEIIWHKPNVMPERVKDRCTKAHEYIFMLTKSPRYYFDSEAIKEPAVMKPQRRNTRAKYDAPGAGEHRKGTQYLREETGTDTPDGLRNKRSVWTVTTKPFKGAHFATFPPDLIKPCVLAGAPVGGKVLDPFLGAGTTCLVAQLNGRDCVGIELNPDYLKIARERLGFGANDNVSGENVWRQTNIFA
jgi:DNA modification methylase